MQRCAAHGRVMFQSLINLTIFLSGLRLLLCQSWWAAVGRGEGDPDPVVHMVQAGL